MGSKDISILETIKEGRTIYAAWADARSKPLAVRTAGR